MVKKTLLSLAIAASTAGLTACNISSTADSNKVDSSAVTAGTEGTTPSRVAPIFSAGNSQLPVANDLLFAINSQLADGEPGKDGTADTADTTPPVTTALNKLDGFSTTAAHYINFNAELNADTVIAGKTVFLIKLKNAEDNAAIDPLQLDTIVANSGASPFADDQLFDAQGNALYEANYITLDEGKTHTIQILPKTPLDPKTKYLVVLTDSIQSATGKAIQSSAEYELLSGNLQIPSSALEPVRAAVQAWEQLSGLFVNAASQGTITQDDLVLSYAFTTTGTTDVLHAMAAPGTFLTSQIPTFVHAEGAITASVTAQFPAGTPQATIDATVAATLDAIASGVATAINADKPGTLATTDGATVRPILKTTAALQPSYYRGLISTIADGQGAGIDAIVDKPKSRTYTPIISGPATPVAVPYDTLLTAQITPKVEAAIEAGVRANPALDGADEATIQAAVDAKIASDLATTVAAQVTALSSKGNIYQGGLTIPNYLPNSEVGVSDRALGTWQGSNNAALALGLSGAPVDKNGDINVTYRFPFADKIGTNTIPVMVTMPEATCDPDGPGPASGKPADGWPVAIYQHGITVDRTAGILIGNTLASQCIAMVAIDHAMHGIAPLNSGGENALRLFNVDKVFASADPAVLKAKSPFAASRAGWISAVGAENAPELVALAERHNNVAKAPDQSNINMIFKGAFDSESAPITDASVGTSGQLYINLQNFARTRDGIRQTVLDMLNLGASIGDMDVDADGTANDLDPANVYFIGHSLGGIVGATFLAVNNNTDVRAYNSNLVKIKAAALGNPGGTFTKLLENSPQIGAQVIAGLAAGGVPQGSENFEKFMAVFQATVDSADPINFASDTTTIPVIVYTDVGGLASATGEADDGAQSDQVVPNNALTPVMPSAKSFLAGTDPLVAEMGITSIVNQETAIVGGPVTGDPKYYFPNAANDSIVRASVRFTKGTHSTFSSADPQDVFAETYQQVITFFDPYGATQLLGLPGDQKGFVVQDITILEAAE